MKRTTAKAPSATEQAASLTDFGSGNVFADLGLSEPVERETKADLAIELNALIERLALTQRDVAARLRIRQPHVSAITNYRLSGFSVTRLMEFIVCLGNDVKIWIGPAANGANGRISVQRCPELSNADAGSVFVELGWGAPAQMLASAGPIEVSLIEATSADPRTDRVGSN